MRDMNRNVKCRLLVKAGALGSAFPIILIALNLWAFQINQGWLFISSFIIFYVSSPVFAIFPDTGILAFHDIFRGSIDIKNVSILIIGCSVNAITYIALVQSNSYFHVSTTLWLRKLPLILFLLMSISAVGRVIITFSF